MRTLLSTLRENDIHLKLVAGELLVRYPKGEIDKHLLEEIRQKKESLISYLVILQQYEQQPIPVIQESSSYALSSSQKRLWVLSQYEAGNVAYNIPGVYVFRGQLNYPAFMHSFDALIARHEILRTVFKENESGDTRQFVLAAYASGFKITYRDLCEEAHPEEQAETYVQQSFITPFDLSTGPMLRADLYQVAPDKWIFSCVMHHIISDGWSMDILISELLQLYNAAAKGIPPSLPPLRIQYRDYAAWEQTKLTGNSLQDHRSYWLHQFAGTLPVLSLQGDKRRPAIQTFRGEAVNSVLHETLSAGIKRLCLKQGATLFMGLLAAVNALLYRYTSQEDIITGSPVAGREHPDVADQIGFYINTLALRARFKGTDSYLQLLENIKTITLEAYQHQVYPFGELVDALQLQRDMSRHPLFDVMVILQHAEEQQIHTYQQPASLKVSSFDKIKSEHSKFDLNFNFTATGDVMLVNLLYNSDIYHKDTATRLLNHLEGLLEAIVADPAAPVCGLDYLCTTEKQLLLSSFNDHDTSYRSGKTIVALWEAQATKHPANTALIFSGKHLTYQEVDAQSNRLAHYLRYHHHTQTNELVGIMLDRSPWMIIAILGVLKSGGAYVPIDPDYPAARKAYIYADTGIRVLLTQTAYLSGLGSYGGDVLEIDKAGFSGMPATPGDVVLHPENLAYVIYTSGTTSTPKGCAITHRSLANYVEWANSYYFNDFVTPHFGLYTSLSFDLTVTSIFCPLTKGGAVSIYPQDKPLADVFRDMFSMESGINSIKLTPSHVNVLPHLELSSSAMQCAIIGGEEVTVSHIRILKEVNPSIHIYNEYGPTEATVGCVIKELQPDEPVLIGRPACGAAICILDENGQLCPVGVNGELYISGPVLARGYLNQPQLTAEKFLLQPFRTEERMYKTGDTGHWLPDGNINYTGRTDDQVKLRGYRIEPGEIERAIQSHAAVDTAVVVLRTDRQEEKALVAYIVSKVALNIAAMRLHLHNTLPAYMVPAYFVQLEALPLNINGKVDKKQLPDPEEYGMPAGITYVAPRNEIEQHLVDAYEEVLRRRPIGITDGFLALGGDSIKSIQILSRLKEKGYSLKPEDMLLYPTIEYLAQQMKTVQRIPAQGLTAGFIPLSPIQHAFFEKDSPDKHHYNQSVLLYSKASLPEAVLRAALDKILLHHDALRMVYCHTPEGWIQRNLGSDQGYSLEIITSMATFNEHCERIQSGISLEQGPLFNACLFRGEDGDHLLLVVHHLVIDGVSWRILFEDLSTLIRQQLSGEPLQLPLKTDAFQYWQEQLAAYASSEALQEEAAYWHVIAASAVDPLPLDNPAGGNLMKDMTTCAFILSEQATERLLTKCYKAYRTEINDLLLTALSLSLSEVFHLDKVMIQLEGHGREPIGGDIDVSRTVGWFTTLYPVVFDMQHRDDMIRQLIAVKESLHRVPNKGIGYGVLRYLGGKNYPLSPEITFNYLGDFGSGITTSSGDQLFIFSGDYHGHTISLQRERDAVLDISGMVVQGKLRIAINFSRQQFTADIIEGLLTAYRKHLEKLVERLSAVEEEHLSPVDMTFKGLSVEQLQKLNQLL